MVLMVVLRTGFFPTPEIYFLMKGAFAITRIISLASLYPLTYSSSYFHGINLVSGKEFMS